MTKHLHGAARGPSRLPDGKKKITTIVLTLVSGEASSEEAQRRRLLHEHRAYCLSAPARRVRGTDRFQSECLVLKGEEM